VQRDRQAAARRHQQGDAARLRRAHDGLDVVLAEDAFDSHRVRPGGITPLLDAGLDQAQPLLDGQLGAGADHAHVDQGQRPADGALDHADPASGETGIDAQHAHEFSSVVRTPVRTTLTPRRGLGGCDAPWSAATVATVAR
jgi:hypothetical protein